MTKNSRVREKLKYVGKSILISILANVVLMPLYFWAFIIAIFNDSGVRLGSYFQFFTSGPFLLGIIPFVVGYAVFYGYVNKKTSLSLPTYIIVQAIFIICPLLMIMSSYYPDAPLIKYFTQISLNNRVSEQNKLFEEYQEELGRNQFIVLDEITAVDNEAKISLYFSSSTNRLIIKYTKNNNDYFTAYNSIDEHKYVDYDTELGQPRRRDLPVEVFVRSGRDDFIVRKGVDYFVAEEDTVYASNVAVYVGDQTFVIDSTLGDDSRKDLRVLVDGRLVSVGDEYLRMIEDCIEDDIRLENQPRYEIWRVLISAP